MSGEGVGAVGLEAEVRGLASKVDGLRPVVEDIRSIMPRIAAAIEGLARVEERLVANGEDHKRIHFRISDGEKAVEGVRKDLAELEGRFEALHDEHLVQVTSMRVRGETVPQKKEIVAASCDDGGWWGGAKKTAITEVVRAVVLLCIGFAAWMVAEHVDEFRRGKAGLPPASVVAPAAEKRG